MSTPGRPDGWVRACGLAALGEDEPPVGRVAAGNVAAGREWK
jgi:hypothetical protein